MHLQTNIYLCRRAPAKATDVVCGRVSGLLRPQRDMEGLPKPALESPAVVTDSHLSTGPPEQQPRPIEEQGDSTATAMGNLLWLASPGSSLEQPRSSHTSASQHRSPRPMLQEEIVAPSPWWRGTYRGLFQALLGATSGPAVRPPLSPSSQRLQTASPETSPPAEAAALGLRSPGWRGRVEGWRVTLGRCRGSGVWGLFVFLF